jgi:hypothetical protein
MTGYLSVGDSFAARALGLDAKQPAKKAVAVNKKAPAAGKKP